jgi:hypothetical protein
MFLKVRRFFTALLFFLFASSLFGAEEISELLERWYMVESALNNWQSLSPPADAAIATDNASDLLSALEQFKETLEAFTSSLLFIET